MKRQRLGREAWPKMDVLVGKAGLVVLVEIGSVLPEDLEVSEDGGRLIIEGERDRHGSTRGFRSLVAEIPRGKFKREVEVPPGFNLAAAKAEYRGGMLRIDVPKSGRA